MTERELIKLDIAAYEYKVKTSKREKWRTGFQYLQKGHRLKPAEGDSWGVYEICNQAKNSERYGQWYVGIGRKPNKRMISHENDKNDLGKDIRRYGWDQFHRQVLIPSILTVEDASAIETYKIMIEYDCRYPKRYNKNNGSGGQPCEELRNRRSEQGNIAKHVSAATIRKAAKKKHISIRECLKRKILQVKKSLKTARSPIYRGELERTLGILQRFKEREKAVKQVSQATIVEPKISTIATIKKKREKAAKQVSQATIVEPKISTIATIKKKREKAAKQISQATIVEPKISTIVTIKKSPVAAWRDFVITVPSWTWLCSLGSIYR